MKRVFYKSEIKEYLTMKGGEPYLNDRHTGQIEYGVVPPSYTESVSTYAKLIEAIRKSRKDKSEVMRDLSIEKHFGKERIYSAGKGWVEEGMWAAGIIKEKDFESYVVEHSYTIVEPTIEELVRYIPLELVIEYINDHPEMKILDVEAWIKAFKK